MDDVGQNESYMSYSLKSQTYNVIIY